MVQWRSSTLSGIPKSEANWRLGLVMERVVVPGEVEDPQSHPAGSSHLPGM